MFTSVTTRRNTLAAAFGLVQRGLKIPGREAAPLSGRGVCPKRLVRVLSAHSVLNLVSEGQTELAQLDPALPTFIAAVREQNALRNRRLKEQLVFLNHALAEHHIRAVALKGAAELLDPVFGSSADRFMGDLDLLVPHSAIDEAVKALRCHGFTDHGAHYDRRGRHAPALYHPDWPTAVELHTAVSERRGRAICPAPALRQRSVQVKAPGLHVPHRRDRLSHLVLHAQVDSGRYQGKWFLLRDAAEFYALAVAMTSEDLAHVRDRFRTANAVALFDGFQVAVEHVLAFEFPQHRPEQEHAAWAAQTLNRLAWPELHRAVYAARAVTDHAARLARHREVRRRHLAALRQPRQRGDFFAQYIMNLRGFQ